jgi:gliding motility-associated transport system ATP-binding protein
VIEVSGLTKTFGSFTALHAIGFQVPGGSVTGFLGLNGAGKSTTLRILSSFLPPTSGSVRICGLDTVRDSLEVRKRIGYLPETVPLYPELRVSEYLAFRARLKGVARGDVRKAVGDAAERCRITDVIGRSIGTLSKGYRQRVGLADAIVHRPQVLILDEPTSGLDPAQRIFVRELIGEVGKDRTVFLSTHIIPEVEAACDSVVVIHRGRIRATFKLSELGRDATTTLRWTGPALGATDTVSGVHSRAFDDPAAASEAASDVVRKGGRVVELASERETLETIFTRMTSGADA